MVSAVEEYLKLDYTVTTEKCVDGTFFASIAEMPGCYASGTTEAEALEILKEAKRLWLLVQLEDGEPIPKPGEINATNL